MKTVLLTGGIGSGKSVVAAYLASRGIPVYDSDSRTRALYDDKLVKALEDELGICLTQEGRFVPSLLSQAIFSDPEALARTEAIVHPLVREDFLAWKESLAEDVPFAVMESAIALEKPLFAGLFDAVVMVIAPQAKRLEWTSRPEAEMRRRMAAQTPDPALADAIIVNDSDIQTLFDRTDASFRGMDLVIPKPSGASLLHPSQNTHRFWAPPSNMAEGGHGFGNDKVHP